MNSMLPQGIHYKYGLATSTTSSLLDYSVLEPAGPSKTHMSHSLNYLKGACTGDYYTGC